MHEPPINGADLVVTAPIGLARLARDVDRYVRTTRAEATRRAYAQDFRTFLEWMGCPECPVPQRFPRPLALEDYAAKIKSTGPVAPEAVALYAAELVRRGRKLKTIERAVAAITVVHLLAGIEPPTRERLVRDTLVGVRRQLARAGRAAPTRKHPLTTDVIVAIVRELDVSTLAGGRDAALLCFGVASALRREELARVCVEHLRLVERGLELRINWSKTDQEGEGVAIPVAFGATPHTCPVRTLQRWLTGAGIERGPVFRAVSRHDRLGGPLSPRAIGEIAKRSAARVGLDPRDFAGHSLRSGFATSAARAGKTSAAIQRITRHRDLGQLNGYIRAATLFDDAGNSGIGL